MELLTVSEAARELRVSPVTVRRYIKSGRLRCVRLGRAIRLRRDDVEGLSQPAEAESFWRGVVPTSEGDPFWRIVGIADFQPGAGSADIHAAVTDAYFERLQTTSRE